MKIESKDLKKKSSMTIQSFNRSVSRSPEKLSSRSPTFYYRSPSPQSIKTKESKKENKPSKHLDSKKRSRKDISPSISDQDKHKHRRSYSRSSTNSSKSSTSRSYSPKNSFSLNKESKKYKIRNNPDIDNEKRNDDYRHHSSQFQYDYRYAKQRPPFYQANLVGESGYRGKYFPQPHHLAIHGMHQQSYNKIAGLNKRFFPINQQNQHDNNKDQLSISESNMRRGVIYPPYSQYAVSNPSMARFNTNFRYYNAPSYYPTVHPHHIYGSNKFPQSKNYQAVISGQSDNKIETLNDEEDSNSSTGEILNDPPESLIGRELENAVKEITASIAEASANGKELVLSKEQQELLQKHQELLQQHQQLKQKHQQEQAALAANSKKVPNYRLLGRNIFEPNYKQQFFKKKIKTNTYYSRFIKQHPTNTLPLAFQKSANLFEDKYSSELIDDDFKTVDSKRKGKSSESFETSASSSQSDTESDSSKSTDLRNKDKQRKIKV